MQSRAPASEARLSRPLPWPREHGAWGMWLAPFLAAAILTKFSSWLLVPALCAAFLAFIVRQPLIVLARQRWVWRDTKPETDSARRALVLEAVLLVVCSLVLFGQLPAVPLLAMGGMAVSMTAAAVWMTLKNRQRSVPLQAASAAGLSATALLACLAGSGRIHDWAWWLWLFQTLHSLGGIFAVHARLDALAALKQPAAAGRQAQASFYQAAALIALQALAAALLSGLDRGALSVPPLFSCVTGALELFRIKRRQLLREPLRLVGVRALAFSILHAALCVIVLWHGV